MLSVLQAYQVSIKENEYFDAKSAQRQIAVLLTFFIISIVVYVLLSLVAQPLGKPLEAFMSVWGICFLVYFLACLWIMSTRPLSGRWYWVELGIIFAGAIIFRVMLLHLPLSLSRDAWRYLWDARVILHGYSPYQHVPFDKVLVPLRDTVFAQTPYRAALTPYPPAAELFFVLGYLLNPTNLIGLKWLFVLMDIVTCATLMVFLARKGRDPRYFIIYAWSPLPIVEFAIQGHVDAITIAFTIMAVLSATSSRRGVRVLVGIFVGLATLTKVYPIVLLLVLMRRRDWELLIACALTIVLGYLPFLLLNHGHVLDGNFLTAAIGQHEEHLGIIQTPLFGIGMSLHIKAAVTALVVHVVEFLLVAPTVILVFVQRIRGRMSMEMAILILIATVLIVYAHVFPWYAIALLPWITLVAVPIWSVKRFSAKGLAVATLWYFTSTVTISYIPALKSLDNTANWSTYYVVSFGVMLLGLGVALAVARRQNTVSSSFA